MLENKFQANLIKELKARFPGCIVMKNDPTYIQGIPDLLLLHKDKWVTSFEGETETTIMFQYGKDFFNGDIVQIANEYGHETKARILEIVRSEDKDGYSVYPTFKTIEQEGA